MIREHPGGTARENNDLEALKNGNHPRKKDGGQGWIRTSEVVIQQIYSLPK
jgi:hypothetical protein